MTYFGTYVNGDVQLNDALVRLPEGVRVNVQVASEDEKATLASTSASSYQRYLSVIGSIKDAPANMAAEHDRYVDAMEQVAGE